ncbi:zinc-binding alcohol dehydrogenase [Agromyces protaetiae]|uniref:Zinc-binding alcohol dehydrogenase n=1 Tax=Agromyces protaetiae TaxID=2509455 RepID=A0A4P6FPH1_9MICO|nr:zinc-binding alcohol dehydrogenase [Agromyces protaetiae]QAY72388.1 zinc-binding alcohol dehydrogenase [Agromyces protaetiae]
MGVVVQFTAPGVVDVVDEPSKALRPDQVRVRTEFSGISAGTELTAYRGSNPYLNRQWQEDSRLFVEGSSTFDYPVVGWGYEEVGTVVEVGGEVEGVREGDRVWGTWGHRSEVVLDGSHAAARILSADVDPIVGVFSQIGAIALNVVLDADIHVGETVAVFGLGVPGQLVAQFARLNGARVIGVDGIAARRELAGELGAEVVLDPGAVDVSAEIRRLTGGLGADACLEISGSARALHEAVRAVAYSSRVCAAGFFQGEAAGLRLGEEFHHNRVQIVGSQISGVAPALQHRWNGHRLARAAIDLASSGRLRVGELVTHRLPVAEASAAYELLAERPADALQVVLGFDDVEAVRGAA